VSRSPLQSKTRIGLAHRRSGVKRGNSLFPRLVSWSNLGSDPEVVTSGDTNRVGYRYVCARGLAANGAHPGGGKTGGGGVPDHTGSEAREN
jgi:hypothetical protein